MSEEKRIYVVVAETVQTPLGSVVQPCGRIAAQCAHVVSKMRMRLAMMDDNLNYEPITTIVLAAPNSKELEEVLSYSPKVPFFDTNEEVYGTGEVLTAICTFPIEPEWVSSQLEHLPLWNHGVSL